MTTTPDKEDLATVGYTLKDRWTVVKKIGGGGFGEIYECFDAERNDELVAVKLESSKQAKQVLKMEVSVLKKLKDHEHVCAFYGSGRVTEFNFVVMSLQGKNLAELRRLQPRQMFSMTTAINLAGQILEAITYIHNIGFLHRDIKPSNFAIGKHAHNCHTVYMLDYGLARQYLTGGGEVRPPRTAAGFRGTVRYASVNTHQSKEMGRHDDLWSLVYMIVEFINGSLPWRKIKDKDEVGKLKAAMSHETLLGPMPTELYTFCKHIDQLTYFINPDTELLKSLINTIKENNNISDNDLFDWEKRSLKENTEKSTLRKTTNNSQTEKNAPLSKFNSKTRTHIQSSAMFVHRSIQTNNNTLAKTNLTIAAVTATAIGAGEANQKSSDVFDSGVGRDVAHSNEVTGQRNKTAPVVPAVVAPTTNVGEDTEKSISPRGKQSCSSKVTSPSPDDLMQTREKECLRKLQEMKDPTLKDLVSMVKDMPFINEIVERESLPREKVPEQTKKSSPEKRKTAPKLPTKRELFPQGDTAHRPIISPRSNARTASTLKGRDLIKDDGDVETKPKPRESSKYRSHLSKSDTCRPRYHSNPAIFTQEDFNDNFNATKQVNQASKRTSIASRVQDEAQKKNSSSKDNGDKVEFGFRLQDSTRPRPSPKSCARPWKDDPVAIAAEKPPTREARSISSGSVSTGLKRNPITPAGGPCTPVISILDELNSAKSTALSPNKKLSLPLRRDLLPSQISKASFSTPPIKCIPFAKSKTAGSSELRVNDLLHRQQKSATTTAADRKPHRDTDTASLRCHTNGAKVTHSDGRFKNADARRRHREDEDGPSLGLARGKADGASPRARVRDQLISGGDVATIHEPTATSNPVTPAVSSALHHADQSSKWKTAYEVNSTTTKVTTTTIKVIKSTASLLDLFDNVKLNSTEVCIPDTFMNPMSPTTVIPTPPSGAPPTNSSTSYRRRRFHVPK